MNSSTALRCCCGCRSKSQVCINKLSMEHESERKENQRCVAVIRCCLCWDHCWELKVFKALIEMTNLRSAKRNFLAASRHSWIRLTLFSLFSVKVSSLWSTDLRNVWFSGEIYEIELPFHVFVSFAGLFLEMISVSMKAMNDFARESRQEIRMRRSFWDLQIKIFSANDVNIHRWFIHL